MVDISILTMVYKPTYNWGAPPCIVIIYLVGGIPTPLKFMSIQELVTKKTIIYIFTLVGGIFVLD